MYIVTEVSNMPIVGRIGVYTSVSAMRQGNIQAALVVILSIHAN